MTEDRLNSVDALAGRPATIFYFIGVTTGKSSIQQIFPLWMRELGFPEVTLEGIDLPPDDAPDHYREVVSRIKSDPSALGGLVTTHKINLLQSARDMFDYLDPYAEMLHEVSSISKQHERLEGHAKDPISAGRTLDNLLGADYFGRTGGGMLCLGAGGAGTAIVLHLCSKASPGDRPARMIVTDPIPARLDHLQQIVTQMNPEIVCEYVPVTAPEHADALMAALPPGSLVINASGLGKDRPGSPVTDAGVFPLNGQIWELNYRGELDFMHQALRQQERRGLHIEDGWIYFLQGWTQVISQVLHIPIEAEMLERLGRIAEQVR